MAESPGSLRSTARRSTARLVNTVRLVNTARWCGAFHNRLQIGQALLELAAAHLIHVHDESERLGHEVLRAAHAPGHECLLALRLEREFHVVGSGKWAEEHELHAD